MQLLTLSSIVGVALASPLSQWGGPRGNGGKSAAYFLDGNPAGGSIVSLHIDGGVISDPVKTSTGGFGADAVDGTGTPNMMDSLSSQGAVTVAGNLLFSVNAGSDTLSMFVIEPEDPWHPKLVGNPASTLGQFPTSVTYSEQLGMACVINGGAVSGVACFSADLVHGLRNVGGLRSLGSSIDQTTPPSGPPNSVSQVLFNPESSVVLGLIKADAGATPPKPGYIFAWPVHHGQISMTPVVTQIADIFMEFGSVWLSDTRLFLTDPAYGASILDVQGTHITELTHTVVPGQVAICWAEYSAALNTAYAIDAGSNNAYKLSPETGALEGSISLVLPDGAAGGFDSAIQGDYMYVLTAASGVAVLDLAQSKQVQYLDLSSLGSRIYWQGMAVYPC